MAVTIRELDRTTDRAGVEATPSQKSSPSGPAGTLAGSPTTTASAASPPSSTKPGTAASSSGSSTSPPARRRGIGRQLLAHAESHGHARGASHVWLESSNVNVPGVAAYERLGYTLCGADSLYYTRYMQGETAIFLAKPL